MRVAIKADKQPQDIYIDIECWYEIPAYVTSATELEDGEQEREFEELLGNIWFTLQYYKCEIVDMHSSNKSWDSYYFAFYIRDTNGELRDDVLVHFRISKHNTKNTDDEKYMQNGKNYYEEMSEKYKIGNEPPAPVFKNIVIGNTQFEDENDVLIYIEGALKKMSEPEADLPYILRTFKVGGKV